MTCVFAVQILLSLTFSLFLAAKEKAKNTPFQGSNPPVSYFFAFLTIRKEQQKVHQHFRPFSRPENKKSSFRAADQPPESPKMPVFPIFLPRMRKETSFIVVDKRRFFYGGEGEL